VPSCAGQARGAQERPSCHSAAPRSATPAEVLHQQVRQSARLPNRLCALAHTSYLFELLRMALAGKPTAARVRELQEELESLQARQAEHAQLRCGAEHAATSVRYVKRQAC
jgi:hypothetical protein